MANLFNLVERPAAFLRRCSAKPSTRRRPPAEVIPRSLFIGLTCGSDLSRSLLRALAASVEEATKHVLEIETCAPLDSKSCLSPLNNLRQSLATRSGDLFTESRERSSIQMSRLQTLKSYFSHPLMPLAQSLWKRLHTSDPFQPGFLPSSP